MHRTRNDAIKVAVQFNSEEKLTKDSFKSECDINNIMKKYRQTGRLPDLVAREPRYGNFADVPDFLTAVQMVEEAETAFLALPADVRRECDNDPAVFLERVRDLKWAEKHKLALPKAPLPAEPVPAATGVVEASNPPGV